MRAPTSSMFSTNWRDKRSEINYGQKERVSKASAGWKRKQSSLQLTKTQVTNRIYTNGIKKDIWLGTKQTVYAVYQTPWLDTSVQERNVEKKNENQMQLFGTETKLQIYRN